MANPDVLGLGRLAKHRRVVAAAERLPEELDRFVRPRRHKQRQLVDATLADPTLMERFAKGESLPRGYGVGLDERVVEYPWLLSRRPSGRTLDAGSALNHRNVLQRFLPLVEALHILTLAPERRSFPRLGVSYVFGDLRALPYRDGWFDTVVCISTLEHVGMDNSGYGAVGTRSADPGGEVSAAALELRRVTAPGGRLLVTVPYGLPEDLGWLRQFDATALEALGEAAGAATADRTFFHYTRGGWDVGSDATAAGARYRTPAREPEPEDLAARARAVACIEFRF